GQDRVLGAAIDPDAVALVAGDDVARTRRPDLAEADPLRHDAAAPVGDRPRAGQVGPDEVVEDRVLHRRPRHPDAGAGVAGDHVPRARARAADLVAGAAVHANPVVAVGQLRGPDAAQPDPVAEDAVTPAGRAGDPDPRTTVAGDEVPA